MMGAYTIYSTTDPAVRAEFKDEFEVLQSKIRVSSRDWSIFTERMNGYTLEEIGTAFGMTGENVRQIEKKIKRAFVLAEIHLRPGRIHHRGTMDGYASGFPPLFPDIRRREMNRVKAIRTREVMERTREEKRRRMEEAARKLAERKALRDRYPRNYKRPDPGDYLACHRRYGVTGKPVAATRTYFRIYARNAKMEAVAWVLVTPDQRLIYVNTINGDASYNWDPGRYNNLPLPPREVLAKKLAKYTQIPVSQCPVAEEA